MDEKADAFQRWLSTPLSPSVTAVFIGTIVAIVLPILLYFYLQRSSAETGAKLPTFLLLGPLNSGKTSLLTHLERGHYAGTHTSQTPRTVEVTLPSSIASASSGSRSASDSSRRTKSQILLVDTPGHGKLRQEALSNVAGSLNLKGIIFVVDAASLSAGSSEQSGQSLRDSAEYLHDVLLLLQRRQTRAATAKASKDIAVLIAANKSDLFTALPASMVGASLQKEISNIRDSRSRGLLDSGIGMGGDLSNAGDEKDQLGDAHEVRFEFSQMEELNMDVQIIGGHVMGSDGANEDSDRARCYIWIMLGCCAMASPGSGSVRGQSQGPFQREATGEVAAADETWPNLRI
ncbi:MAG: hypothetical protein M1817_001272 [Caeruleum heppii]|nr:MAG: hypothetical protein M1817_001272 [Caeruleum heppii]